MNKAYYLLHKFDFLVNLLLLFNGVQWKAKKILKWFAFVSNLKQVYCLVKVEEWLEFFYHYQMFLKLTSMFQHLLWNCLTLRLCVVIIFLLSIRYYLRHYICCLLMLKIIITFVPIFSIFIELVLPFNFTFYIIIHPWGFLSSNVDSMDFLILSTFALL